MNARWFPSSRSVVWLIVIFAVAFVLSAKYHGYRPQQNTPIHEVRVMELVGDPACDPTRHMCNALGGDVVLGVRLLGEVGALKPFTVAVQVNGLPPGAVDGVQVEFVMPHMDMGLNRYVLKAAGTNQWQGAVTLPICSTGRRDWQAIVRANTESAAYVGRFPFVLH
ncbi:MAG: hypothetical protein P8090_14780 [Gammaproteobacteria bacterium]